MFGAPVTAACESSLPPCVPRWQLPALWVVNRPQSFRFNKYRTHVIVALVSLWAWVLVMATRPHKEERFMFPVYPLIALAAAAVVREALVLYDAFRIKVRLQRSRGSCSVLLWFVDACPRDA